MMRLFKAFAAALLGLVMLSACGPKPADDAMVRGFFDHIRTGEISAIEGSLAPNLQAPGTNDQIEGLRRQYIPPEAPTNSQRINWSFVSTFGGDSTATFVYRYDYPDRVLIVTTNTRTAPGGPTLVEGFHVNVTPVNAETAAAYDFTFTGKPPRQLAFFGAMILSLLLMIAAFFGTIFTKGFKRKWLFAIIALLGAPVFVMNWTTGAWTPTFSGGLLNVGMTRGLAPLDPWILKFHIPIGAIIVLSLLWPRWAGLHRTEEEQPPEPS